MCWPSTFGSPSLLGHISRRPTPGRRNRLRGGAHAGVVGGLPYLSSRAESGRDPMCGLTPWASRDRHFEPKISVL